MLAELFILNFAIIDDLRLRFDAGFNVMTGETGAGKSIILDAMALVLGERADMSMIRSGCEAAYVEATFQIGLALNDSLASIIEAEGLEGETDSTLMLSRELRANGRNICRINGRAVNLGILRAIGERLVDIHGQGEHLSLMKPDAHLPLLDAYATVDREKKELRQHVLALRGVQKELRALQQDERTLAQRVDLLTFQVKEINAANLELGEEEELRAERTRMTNVEQLIRHSGEALSFLNGQDDEMPAAVDLLGQADRSFSNLARLDKTMEPFLERLQGLSYQLSDLVAELIDYQAKLEFEPARLSFLEERIEMIARLKRKYGNSIEEILAWRDKAQSELDHISHSEEKVAELQLELDKLLHVVGALAHALSQKRQAAAKIMSSLVEVELEQLHMEKASFEIAFDAEEEEEGAYVEDRRLQFDETGIDRVEFLVSANPGEPLKPLAKVASGGETSRLMLALKTVLARVDMTPTLIFDEIDQGIGGRVGDVVGQKLWRLTKEADHQVIVVTHLPQLAGYADGHFHVSKKTSSGRTTTAVTKLELPGRIQELAAMLGMQDEHATGGAESIVARVASVKSSA